MAKTEKKQRARELRSQGMSYKEIAKDLELSSSTVSLWCRDVELSPEQLSVLERHTRDPHYGRRWKYLMRLRKRNARRAEKLRNESMEELVGLCRRETLVAGAALYWAEGFKKDKMVGFANSDPGMVKFILKWLRKSLGVKSERVRLRVVINESHKYRVNEITHYWSGICDIGLESFYRPTFQKAVWRKVYDRPEEYFGVLRIRVLKSTDLLRRILGLVEGIKLNI